jgi:NADPH-dependent 2,4-dienoyl-CoA reductase/sulfur reductase-like enzyme
MTEIDAIIIGGGPAGLAAAAELYKKGIHDILILEREPSLGGILRQCIHDGFGLTRFKETLSGPEYAQRFIDKINAYHIPYLTDTMVLNIKAGTKKIVTAASRNVHVAHWASLANGQRAYLLRVQHKLI